MAKVYTSACRSWVILQLIEDIKFEWKEGGPGSVLESTQDNSSKRLTSSGMLSSFDLVIAFAAAFQRQASKLQLDKV